MTPADLVPLLRDFYAERLAILQRHVASARRVGDYDVNNAYQYVVAREETHLLWVHRAILDVGGTVPPEPTAPGDPSGTLRDIASADAAANRTFVAKWAPKVAEIGHDVPAPPSPKQ